MRHLRDARPTEITILVPVPTRLRHYSRLDESKNWKLIIMPKKKGKTISPPKYSCHVNTPNNRQGRARGIAPKFHRRNIRDSIHRSLRGGDMPFNAACYFQVILSPPCNMKWTSSTHLVSRSSLETSQLSQLSTHCPIPGIMLHHTKSLGQL